LFVRVTGSVQRAATRCKYLDSQIKAFCLYVSGFGTGTGYSVDRRKKEAPED